ncbi:MAG: hypothetical protein MZV63_58410 [Marinilabiliales bacterium]|nr:hypothetical protein [Marinilabiliales bacterium]
MIEKESRQESTLNLIAAENTAPAAVLEALGSSFNNKTAEGYPGPALPHRLPGDGRDWSSSRWTAPRRCSARATPTCSRTPGSTPTSRSTAPC